MANISGFVKKIRDIMRNDEGVNGDAQRIEQLAWILFLKVYDAKEDDWEFSISNFKSIIPEQCRWRSWAKNDTLTGELLLDFVNNQLFPTLKKLPISQNTLAYQAIVQTTFIDAHNYMKNGVYLKQIISVVDEIDFGDVKESHAFGEIYETILKGLQNAGSAGEFYTPRAVTSFMAKMIKPQIGENMADFACGTGGFLTSWLAELKEKGKTAADQEKINKSVYAVEKKQFPYMLCVTNMLLHDLDNPDVYRSNALMHNLLDYTDRDKFEVILMNPPYGGHEDNSVKSYFPDDLASSETADLFMSVIMYRLKQNGRAAVILPDGFLFGTDNAKLAIKKKLINEFNLHTIIRMPQSVFAPYTSITTNILFFDNNGPTKETWFYRVDMPADRKHFSKTKPMELKHFADAVSWWENRQEIIKDDAPKAKKFTAEEIASLGYNLDQCGYPHKEEIILPPDELISNYQHERAAVNETIDDVLAQITKLIGGNTL